MYISARERKILELLLNHYEEMTVKDLANELAVSPRTVHRDLKGVEEILQENSLELNKKSGIGIQIIGNQEDREKLRLFLFHLSHHEYTPEERQTFVLSALLDANEPVKLLALANELNVTIATISHDLNKIEEQVKPFGLTLLRKRGYGVEVIGKESAKRKAMSKLIMENIEESELLSILKETIQKKSAQTEDTITDRLLGLVDKKKLLIIEKQIETIKDDLPYSLADSAYIGLVVHLALAIERIQHGEEIHFDQDFLEGLKDTKEFEVAQKIVANLEGVFRIHISPGEIGYITMHLLGAKLRTDHDDLFEELSIQVGYSAQKLIHFVSEEIGFDLTRNISLLQGLVAHLRPALYRIKQNMGISNPLLPRIELEYNDMFSILEKAVKVIFPDLEVPKEEIGYLVMHFASALLNKEQDTEHNILVVCSSGIGTSKILSTKLKQEIPGLKTVNASLFDLEKTNVKEFDAIVTTVPLKDLKEDYLVVSPLLSAEEVNKIKRLLLTKQTFSNQRQKVRTEARPFDHGDFLEQLQKIKNYSAAIYEILSSFGVYHLEADSVEGALNQVCDSLYMQNAISHIPKVIEDLLRREHIGGLGIPGTSLALYHTKSEYVQVPCFTVCRLNHPISVRSMDGSQIEMNSLLLLLSPKEADEESLEILSSISSLIIRDERSIKMFQLSQEDELADFLGAELKAIYQEKVK
ncbi:BglG family transcriptional antiterminator [Bacillus oleivorans]|uniref:BglG family transcriptional antiterminator n=1 Tax=Bacillus oleivorans TaxID=1448271 RepID=A0A285D3Y1_9BACI|nr:BglG family transcription antiterminator [Bacillus oleivorans]SNX74405.1 BglG family transcriptional antiterminator [Bacillus oleivorans]